MRAKPFRTVNNSVQQRRRSNLSYVPTQPTAPQYDVAEALALAFGEEESVDEGRYVFEEPLRQVG